MLQHSRPFPLVTSSREDVVLCRAAKKLSSFTVLGTSRWAGVPSGPFHASHTVPEAPGAAGTEECCVLGAAQHAQLLEQDFFLGLLWCQPVLDLIPFMLMFMNDLKMMFSLYVNTVSNTAFITCGVFPHPFWGLGTGFGL